MADISLQDKLVAVLRNLSIYCSEDGILLKNKIVADAHNLNPTLLKALLADTSLKEHFFEDVDGITVFDKVKFQRFVSNKNFLPDSFTSYKNKIGLTSPDGQDFISESGEVVLTWPYKDCVLEGGQDKEDSKRNEIFYNEILAPDEITRLTEPKALTSFKFFDSDGEHEIEDIANHNLIIKGNNLLVLSSLCDKYRNSIQVIYIDPPYYFKEHKEKDTFKYNSNFHLSTWLTFMRNRIKYAYEMLKTNGTIWVNISEDGMHYLKVLLDDIFGADCFVGTLPRRTRSGKSDVPFNLSQDFDWILVYTKASSKDKVVGRGIERKYFSTPDYPGRPWRLADLTKQTSAKDRPNSFFTLIDPKTGKQYPPSESRTWAITSDTFPRLYREGYVVFPDDYDFINITKPYARKFKDQDDSSGKLSSVISDFLIKDFLSNLLNSCKNEVGNYESTNLFGIGEFDFAKPENLIAQILSVASKEGDLVMDFFLGSGTTCAVAHKMKRKYIGIDQMDYIESLAVNRLKQVISGEQGGVSVDYNWQGGGSFVYCELAKANARYLDDIKSADSDAELLLIWERMKDSSLLSFKVKPNEIDPSSEDFRGLSIDDKKRFLIACLDKNMLYVPYSDIESMEYGISKDDIHLNRTFYRR
ncbi:MAG: site-specific DNA-methyltransferase [Muribaculaceae bacterium]|nr:site-specific DNA-methyltransferase [Muribaculaceae bacterium]